MNMQIVVRQADDNTVDFHITIPAEDVNTLIERYTIDLAYQNNISPDEGQELDEAVAAKLGAEYARRYISESSMYYALPFAAESQHIDIIGRPCFEMPEMMERDVDFSFSAHCALKPSIGLTSYDPVEITVPALEVTDGDIERYLDALAQSHASTEEEEGRDGIELGDNVEIAIETYRDGERCDQLCSEGRTYTTGAQQMPDAFDSEILSMRVGQTKTIEYDVPGSVLGEDLKPVDEHYVSTVTVNKIERTVIPDLTDEWIAENVPTCANMDDLRKQVAATILERKSTEYRHYKNLQSAKELAKRLRDSIPPQVSEAVLNDVRHQFDEQLKQQGITVSDFLVSQSIDEAQLTAYLSGQVQEQLARELALDAVAGHFGLEADDDAMNEYFRVASSPGLEEMMKLDFERNGKMSEARLSAVRLKANDYVTEHAIVNIEP